ncbi:MAG: copper-binding transcription factor [Piccolia ochrophora]|nr:MAG: copper-binding transcription factor [Piccolia ochrophora]
MSLRKGATFHSPTTPPSDTCDPILHIPSLPKRSPTCPRILDAVVAAGERRMAALIGSFDRSLSDAAPPSPGTKESLRGEDLPLPRGMLDAAVSGPASRGVSGIKLENDRPDALNDPQGSSRILQRRAQPDAKHHPSDSGIGSTISGTIHSSSDDDEEDDNAPSQRRRRTKQDTTFSAKTNQGVHSAITRSLSAISQASGATRRALSVHAAAHIAQHIIQPLLHKATLKDFHPLVRDIPRRIDGKEILCLRDLEKTLILLAPVSQNRVYNEEYATHSLLSSIQGKAKSPSLYLSFCETSIQCIHTTVEHINEHDQRRPTDAPYNNGYFLDLVGQVRQYAGIMAASREREAAGSEPNEQEYSPSESLVLQGGLSQTGRPARLVRVKGGKPIPLGTDRAGDPTEEGPSEGGSLSTSMKRSHSENSSEESVLRSMARRRKLSPGEVVSEPAPQICGECNKEFKRPCDLTKHEKTHSRPWKCPEPSCRYHSHGWPTEKERDRHANDKHSEAPARYECLYPPCTYKSKRESNCKQHMEKAHGWNYVRAKGNGKRGSKKTPTQTPQTPQIPTPRSFPHDESTPMTGGSSTYDEQYLHGGDDPMTASGVDALDNGSLADITLHYDENSLRAPSNYHHPYESGFQGDYSSFDGLELSVGGSSTSIERLSTAERTADTPLDLTNHMDHHFDIDEIDWDSLNNFDVLNTQLMTPDHSVEHRLHDSFTQAPSNCVSTMANDILATHTHNLSSNGQPNIMLYSPASADDIVADEGFDDFVPTTGKPTNDFRLFASDNSSTVGSANDGMFPELPSFENQMLPNHAPLAGSGLSQQLPVFTDYMELDPCQADD